MIKFIKLVNGDDIICEIEKKDGIVKLKKPHRLLFSQEGLASMPLCPFSSDEVYEIDPKNILFEAEPEKDIKDSYANQVGAIVIPDSSILKP